MTTNIILIPGFILPPSSLQFRKPEQQARSTVTTRRPRATCSTFIPSLPHHFSTCWHRRSVSHRFLRMRCTPVLHQSPNASPPTATSRTGRPFLSPLLILVPCLVILPFVLRSENNLIPAIRTIIKSQGPLQGSITLFFSHIVSVLCCFPANAGLQIAAGGLLPLPLAFIIMWSSKTVAAILALLLGRAIFARRLLQGNGEGLWGVAKKPAARRILKVLDRVSTGDDAWKLVLLLRLSPVPGFMLNYVSSLTQVPLIAYAWATAFGTAPSVFNWVLIGAATREGASAIHNAKLIGGRVAAGNGSALAGALAIGQSALRMMVIASGFGLMWLVTRIARRIIAQVEKEIALEDAAAGEPEQVTDAGT